jgi:hypothetical protein
MKKPSAETKFRLLRLAGRLLLAASGLLLVVGLLLVSMWPPVNRVEAGQSAEYPALMPMAYPLREERVFAGVLSALSDLSDVTIETSDPVTGVIQARRGNRFAFLAAQITVSVAPNGAGGSIVHVVSTTVGGRGDFGQNARNIGELQRVLTEEIGSPQASVGDVAQREFSGSPGDR